MSLLEVRGVSKSFRGLRAVSNASFDVAEGSIVALIGPNGAGKTTIFNMIAGVFAPDAGTIVFAGKPIHGLRPDQVCAAGIGRTFQIVKPFAGLSRARQRDGRRAARRRKRRRGARRARAGRSSSKLGLGAKARPAGLVAHPARPQAARGGARARHAAAAAAARRSDGGPAPDRVRPDGRGVPRAQPARRPHHPADRARHARGDGARRSRSSCCTTARSSPAARPDEVVRDPAVLECYLGEETEV